MPLLQAPTYPIVDEPNPFRGELDRAKALFDREIDNTSGWEDIKKTLTTEDDDVKLEKKSADVGAGASQIPMVRGTCTIPNTTTDKIVPILQTAGIRRKWDPRFETAWILRRFSETSVQFYSLGNSPPALKWLIWPRDISGVSQVYIGGREDNSLAGTNAEIIVVQTSVTDDTRASEQKSATRMRLTLPVGNNVEVIYLVKTDLGGSIPQRLVASVIEDVPMCAAKLRKTYLTYGYSPYVVHDSTTSHSLSQSEIFHFGPTKNDVHQPLPNDKHWHCHMTGRGGTSFVIHYDVQNMYKKSGGVHTIVKGEGKDAITLVDDGNGRISVTVGQGADGKNFEIIVGPHGGARQS